MSATRHYTASDLGAMPSDGNRYEIVHGELLVTPSPILRHQVVAGELHGELRAYLSAYGLSRHVVMAPSDVTGGDDTVVEPDVYVADTADALRTETMIDLSALYLAIEVISPSSLRADRILKRQLYQQHGIPQYWVVDAAQQQVEVWTPDAHEPVVEHELLTWRHPTLDVSCEIDLVRLFDFD